MLIFLKVPPKKMLHISEKMLSHLLGLFILSSTCLASYLPNSNSTTRDESSGFIPNSENDPNTHNWGELKGPTGFGPMVPTANNSDNREPWPPNMSGPGSQRMLLPADSTPLPAPNTAVCDMLFSAPVPPSINQIPFFCICSYCKGTLGAKGDRGDRGPPGLPGSSGNRGMMGFKGYRGFTGLQGIKGQKGDLGEKGLAGVPGFTGTKGDRGLKGEKGDLGLMGPPGEQGPQGEMGSCPASCETIPGPPGLQGLPGPVGAQGLPGKNGSTGPKGVKGDKGDNGVPGDPGVHGQKGDQGAQGVCECTNGTDGKPGAKGSKGDKGDQGVQGVAGPIGSKGDKGNEGFMGPPGPCSPAIQAAFSASLNQSFPAPNWPVAFNQIITNQFGFFNPQMGMYTAPVNGTYVFSFSLAVADRPLKAGLFRNYYPVIKVTETSNLATVSQTVVLHLSAGDRVWIQVKDTATNGMYTDSESTSVFSGYLLHPDTCDVALSRDFGMMPTLSHDFSWNPPKNPPTPASPHFN